MALTEIRRISPEDGILPLPGGDAHWIWAFTCPTPECPCRTAVVVSGGADRDALILAGAPVRDAWVRAGSHATAASELSGVTSARVMAKKMKLDPKLEAWIGARRRHRLSHAHVQMARELGMNPTKLGSVDNHRQEPWKLPLPEFIEPLYEKRFGKTRPNVVVTIEEYARASAAKDAERKARKLARRAERAAEPGLHTKPEGTDGS